MSTTTGPVPSLTLRGALGWHRPLMVLAAAMAVLTVVGLVGLAADDRVLTGLPIWAKPTKFALSTLVYAVTWAWLVALVREHRPVAARWTHRAGTVAALLLGVELVVIVLQVLRSTTSHFNRTTPLNSTLFTIMAVSIVAVWLASLYAAAQLFRVRGLDPARGRAIRAGAVLAVVGMGSGVLMTLPGIVGPTVAAGITGAHTVGLADGGPGLPLLGWSTAGGDLRIPHFVGMHALQVLPLLLLGLELLAARVAVLRSAEVRSGLVGVAAAAYTGLLAVLTWQALRGQAVVAPDAATVAATGAVLLAATVGAAVVLRRSPVAT
ncbi:hypothetical protein LWC35_28085 [Pseudonocardia kujensis]|uniref:hypothetical protein n=1 Tax=Pseudonocardia kujensis TaxID=1128675 RepID=UPI001E62C763|nr:hypothetical protein [Pseudonocardia kujensis]MCE0766737.1 hypothetical protein [Pseudonocardia kujensis]